jgi:hypothetical protein
VQLLAAVERVASPPERKQLHRAIADGLDPWGRPSMPGLVSRAVDRDPTLAAAVPELVR